MEVQKITAHKSGDRLDTFLTEAMDISRSYIQKLLKEGRITVNGETVKANYKVKEGDAILCEIPDPVTLDAVAQDIPLDIVYEDDDLFVINKRAGMSVHPAPGSERDTLVNALLYLGKELSGINGVIRPGIVHRIDKDTTGLLLVAKNDQAHQFLAEEIKNHRAERTYYAIVKGNFGEKEGTIRAPIGRNPKDRKKMAVVKDGKEAITHFTVLERFLKYTYLKIQLETGRTHQIRVHLSYIHHPILGDPLYGNGNDPYHLNRQALHAGEIAFTHPKTGEKMHFEAPLPQDFAEILTKLRNERMF